MTCHLYENYEYETAGVLDGHVMLGEHIHCGYFLVRDKKFGFRGMKTPQEVVRSDRAVQHHRVPSALVYVPAEEMLRSRPAGREAFLGAAAYIFSTLREDEPVILDFKSVKILAPS